jgi:hypothetical protein
MTNKKDDFKILSIKIECAHCLLVSETENYEISSSSDDCDLCGSHGSIDLGLYDPCPSCNKKFDDIELRSW